MKSLILLFLCYFLFSLLKCNLRSNRAVKAEKALVESEAETSYQLSRLNKMISSLQSEFNLINDKNKNSTSSKKLSKPKSKKEAVKDKKKKKVKSEKAVKDKKKKKIKSVASAKPDNDLSDCEHEAVANTKLESKKHSNKKTHTEKIKKSKPKSIPKPKSESKPKSKPKLKAKSKNMTDSKNITKSKNKTKSKSKNKTKCKNKTKSKPKSKNKTKSKKMTQSNIKKVPSSESKSETNKTTNVKPCNCRNKITAAHMFALNSIIAKARKGNGNSILHDIKMKKEPFKKKKLTKYFVKKLLQKFQIKSPIIKKCLKAPLSTYAKILKLAHEIGNGKSGFGQFVVLGKWLCEELKIIPEKLNDSSIFNDVRSYVNSYIHKK